MQSTERGGPLVSFKAPIFFNPLIASLPNTIDRKGRAPSQYRASIPLIALLPNTINRKGRAPVSVEHTDPLIASLPNAINRKGRAPSQRRAYRPFDSLATKRNQQKGEVALSASNIDIFRLLDSLATKHNQQREGPPVRFKHRYSPD